MRNEADNLAAINQMKLDNMQLYWDEVQGIINQGSEAVLGFLQSWNTTYLEASTTQQEDYNEWRIIEFRDAYKIRVKSNFSLTSSRRS